MSKAILVIDMPSSCFYCDFCHTKDYNCNYQIDGDKYCCIKELNVNDYYYDEKPIPKPKWCPLMSLPEKKIVVPMDTASEVVFKYGWNSCLDNILEKNNE